MHYYHHRIVECIARKSLFTIWIIVENLGSLKTCAFCSPRRSRPIGGERESTFAATKNFLAFERAQKIIIITSINDKCICHRKICHQWIYFYMIYIDTNNKKNKPSIWIPSNVLIVYYIYKFSILKIRPKKAKYSEWNRNRISIKNNKIIINK